MQMTEATLLTIVRCILGVILVGIYAITGMNGVILILAAFLVGIPIEEVLRLTIQKRELKKQDD